MSTKPEKPKTRKAAVAGTGINPKLLALAAKIDEAKALYDSLMAKDVDEEVSTAVLHKEWKLEDKLATVAAVNLEEMKLKARNVDRDSMGEPLPESIIRDLLALSRKPKASASKQAKGGSGSV